MTITELAPPQVRTIPITTEGGDHERQAHIVFPKDALVEATVMGTPVVALCGRTWIPSRDPERYPVCKSCVEAFEKATGRHWPGRR